MRLRGRAAIITGASQGLGKAIAASFLREGASVLLTARDGALLAKTGQELAGERRDNQQQVLVEAMDVSRAEDVERTVARATAELGGVDILVCNAGVYGPMGAIETVDWSTWVQAIHINLLGTVLCCRAIVPQMRQRGRGKIILLSGGGATGPLPFISAYAASKAAVVRFGETLAHELDGSGVDVNAIAPGALNTRLLQEVLAAGPGQVGESFYQRSLRQKEEGGAPLSAGADLATFLASDESNGITGRIISAVWDDWRALLTIRDRLQGSDVYTLRRIVPVDRGWEEP